MGPRCTSVGTTGSEGADGLGRRGARGQEWPWRAGGCRRGTHLQAVQEELHATEAEEHLTVVGRLVCDVPQRAPGELHDLVTLRAGGAQQGWPGPAPRAPAPSEGPRQTRTSPGPTSPMLGCGRAERLHEDDLLSCLAASSESASAWSVGREENLLGPGLQSSPVPSVVPGSDSNSIPD